MAANQLRVAYLLKVYPRFSETFIVNEILAHEAAGLPLEIYSLRSSNEGRFHENYARVQAPVSYISAKEPRANQFWQTLQQAHQQYPNLWQALNSEVVLEVSDICQALELARICQQRGITHIHAHFGTVATTVAWLVHQLTGLPYLFTAHAKDIFHENVINSDLQRKLQDAAHVITVSDYNLAYLRSRFGDVASRVTRIYNGMELERFPWQSPEQRPRRIVSVGRLVEKKGMDVLISACALLAQRFDDFSCDILGDGELAEPLQAQLNQLGLQKIVRLLGAQPQSEVIRHVQSAAVFAAPCVIGADGNRDGLPTVLLEAMALGTPCISTDVTGIPEVLQHNQTGLMVPQRDPASLAAALEHLLIDPALRMRLAQNARSLIESQFDIHQNSAQLRSLYETSLVEATALPALEALL